MTNVKQAVPFFRVANIERSIRFYVDGLGFEITNKWVDHDKLRWCWLQSGGAALMLQEFPKAGHDSWLPEGKVGEGISICFMCDDALEIPSSCCARSEPIETSCRKQGVGNVFIRS